MLRRTVLGLMALFLLPWSSSAENAATRSDWPQFRGPKRDGVSSDTGLLTSWPKEGPPLLWEAKGCGRGYASVAVTGGRVFTMGDGPSTADDKDEYVLCFDDTNGKQLWKAKLGPAWNRGSESWQSSRSTPTVDGDRVYALTAYGDLVCLETATGREVWRKNLNKDFGGRKGDGWGYSESVLIDGDKLICTPGGPKSTMVALNKRDGSLIWAASVPNDRGAGHASAVVAEIGGIRVYVQTSASGAFAVRASDGKFLWHYPFGATAVIPTPIVRGDLVFVDAGYGTGGALLKQIPDGDSVKMEVVYPLKRELNNKHGGIVLVGDYIYGDTDANGVPWCAEFLTGTVRWKQRGSGSGSASITYADGHLYVRYSNGVIALVKATPEGYKESGSFKIPHSGSRPSWSHPVVVNGRLYLREGDYLLCYDVRAK
ncbi:MAG: PQQ-like beta-propeller repeat protein [Gemmataceae bacterium]|nr:PQQ-like beta-propeller repeat protein [Gemmataceae bacterium]MDW8265343.1 PQQ-binding-like beta-propeller repeat protein [Gemmataceae bacterium]